MNWKQFQHTVLDQWIWFVNDQLKYIGVKPNHLTAKTQHACLIPVAYSEKLGSGRQNPQHEE
ncbi:MAG: hypothetical protein HOP23_00980 [Methylococcaceae bacterium]|nr:hypothetical protein [Methylococcaceae bacterium]